MTGFTALQVEQSSKVGMLRNVAQGVTKGGGQIIDLFQDYVKGVDPSMDSLWLPHRGFRSHC